MSHKTYAIIFLIIAILLFLLLLFILVAWPSEKDADDSYANAERLSGTELRYMMNEAKYSPGQSDAYAQMHPDFAWLFDGSFVTYIYD